MLLKTHVSYDKQSEPDVFKGFLGLRALVLLRSISRELTRANDLTEARLAIEHPEQYKRRLVQKRKVVRTGESKSETEREVKGTVSTASVEKWNENYRKLHPEDPDEANAAYIP